MDIEFMHVIVIKIGLKIAKLFVLDGEFLEEIEIPSVYYHEPT